MKSFSEIIAALGVPVLAEAFGVRPSHIRTMKARDSVPPEYWGELIGRADSAGITVDYSALREIRANRFSQTREAA